jgi:hypothetical protein
MAARTCATLVVLIVFSSGARAAPPAGKPAKPVDLELHEPPPGVADSANVSRPGATLRPPRSSMAAPTQFQLRALSDGGYLYAGTAFDARIAPDGSVTFSASGSPLARDADVRAPGRDPPTAPGREPTTSPEPVRVGGGPSVHFDATNEYLRRLHKDPARDAKAAFLTATFELRMKMALEARHELRQAAQGELPARLAELWSDPRLTVAERQQLLLAMWTSLGGEQDGAARAIVRDFARHHLPRAKAAAFH